MSNSLIPADFVSQAKYADTKALSVVTSSRNYLPRIQLMGSSSDIVKQGDFPVGQFALIKNKVHQPIGKEVIMLILAWRPQATQFKPDVLNAYNPETDLFKSIKARADADPQSSCGYGPNTLIWLPEQGETATFFLSNPTGRNEATNFLGYLGKPCVVKSELIVGKKHKWHGPKTYPYEADIKLPDFADPEFITIRDEFLNPPEATREVPETSDRAR